MGVRDWITARLVAFLTAPVAHYEHRVRNDLDALKRHVRKGDVLLVEGEQRVSAVIKYLTQSSWSHAALYVGDELLRRGGEVRRRALAQFGDEAEHLLVEALFDGVVAAPLSKYADFNLRLCRPHRLQRSDLAIVLDDALAAIGWRYDLRNILDLARHLMRISLTPGRAHREALRLGSSTLTEVMCSSLLGGLFHRVGFPVLPSVEPPEQLPPRAAPRRFSLLRPRRPASRAGLYRPRHPTLLTPRDFDISPYFEIVKFNVIREGDFDYQRIEWADDPAADEKLAG